MVGDDGWTTTQLGDVAAINPDIIGRDWPYDHVRYIDIASVGEGHIQVAPQLMEFADAPSRAKRLLSCGDTVLSTVRPNRRSMFFAAQPEPDWVVSTGFAVLRPQAKIIAPRFLYACIFNQSFTEYLISREKGAAYPAVSPEDIANAVIPLPPLKEQQAIACILGTLDDKIELNRKMSQTLEEVAAAIFKSWFIDFDPVRRNAARAQNQPSPPTPLPEVEGSHAFDHLFPDSFEDSELGMIPKGWKIGALGNIADSPRRNVNPSDLPPTTPYIGLEHMPRQSIALNSWSLAESVASGKSLFKQGEILFGKLRPYFHKVGIAPMDGVCSTDIVVVKPKAEDWHGYVISLVSSKAFVDYTDLHSAGTRMPRANWKDMSRYLLSLPPEPLATAFQEPVAALHKRICVNIHQNFHLVNLRDTLLPKLMSGEIKLAAAETIAEEETICPT